MSETHEEQADTPIAACVQFDVRRGEIAANLAAATSLIEEARATGATLCVLPEMWTTSFLTEYDPQILTAAAEAEEILRELSYGLRMVLVGSGPLQEGQAVYNCARVYDHGEVKGTYRKLHMFSPNMEHKHHQPGERAEVITTSAGRLGVVIGYDLRFPELARHYFHMGAEILVVPAQWPEPRSQHWRTLLRARAIESGLFVIGSNRTGQEPSLKTEDNNSYLGDGRIVDPTGEILAAGSGDEAIVSAAIELKTVRTLRRVLPIDKDQRPAIYRQLLEDAWQAMNEACRDNDEPSGN